MYPIQGNNEHHKQLQPQKNQLNKNFQFLLQFLWQIRTPVVFPSATETLQPQFTSLRCTSVPISFFILIPYAYNILHLLDFPQIFTIPSTNKYFFFTSHSQLLHTCTFMFAIANVNRCCCMLTNAPGIFLLCRVKIIRRSYKKIVYVCHFFPHFHILC